MHFVGGVVVVASTASHNQNIRCIWLVGIGFGYRALRLLSNILWFFALTARYIKYLFIYEIIHYYCYPMAFLFIMILNIIVLWCLMWYSMVSMATFGCFRFVHLHTSFTHHIFSICIVSSLILFLCAVCVGVFDVEHRCSCIPNAFIDINLVFFFFCCRAYFTLILLLVFLAKYKFRCKLYSC